MGEADTTCYVIRQWTFDHVQNYWWAVIVILMLYEVMHAVMMDKLIWTNCLDKTGANRRQELLLNEIIISYEVYN